MSKFPIKDACQLLDADHIAVKHLFVDYARLAVAADAATSTAQRTALALQICDALALHAQIEEQIFYPALRAARPDAAGLLDEADVDHLEAKQLIADIRHIGTANAAMDTLVAELNVAIDHHVKEERDQLFPMARTAPGLDLMALGAQLLERQNSVQDDMAAMH